MLAKVLKKIGFQLSKNDITNIVTCVPNAVEHVLKLFRDKIKTCQTEGMTSGGSQELSSDKAKPLSEEETKQSPIAAIKPKAPPYLKGNILFVGLKCQKKLVQNCYQRKTK